MEQAIQAVQALAAQHFQSTPQRIEKLPQSGSDRIYFRLYYPQQTYIATYNQNIKENSTFLYFAEHFYAKQLPVPKIIVQNTTGDVYFQEDLGNKSLLNCIEEEGHSENVLQLFKQSLKQLAQLQIKGHEGLDYQKCITAKEFGKQAILSDLLYFKYYFLDAVGLPYDKQAMLDDFDALSTYLTKTEYKYFMFRDFQSRNIMVQNNQVHFIDFQGGMQGALQYDVASLLWQAKAELSEEWKNQLLHFYMDEIDTLLDHPINRTVFVGQYNGYVLIRLLQVLGAYGFRGLFERKAHFLSSIPLALKNLKYFLQHQSVGIITPEFDRVLQILVGEDMVQRFTPPTATEQTPLKININSFSYKKGLPKDETENGGGFIFDMRGILNPGRFEEYKRLSGLDKPVQDFLEQRTKMSVFLNSVWDLIDITVENYLSRDFEHLQINFGCTGGQHRSVYAAEQTARHLRNKYKLKVTIQHTNQENWLK